MLVTYDSERVLGTKEGRDGFDGNYILKEYTIENPQYMCELMTTEPMDFPGEFREQIGNVITTPQLNCRNSFLIHRKNNYWKKPMEFMK